jgi:glycine cleavage system regulatory protein
MAKLTEPRHRVFRVAVGKREREAFFTDMDTFIAGMKSALEAEPHERASLFRLVIVADILHTRLTALEKRLDELAPAQTVDIFTNVRSNF